MSAGLPTRPPLWLASGLYAAFVVYGSLLPFDFHSLPWGVAVARFAAIPFIHLGVGSRADWVANLILYLPLGYLVMALLAGRSRLPWVWAVSAFLTVLLVGGIAVAVEFAQLYFPPRTVSLNDLYAEWLGGALGMLLWGLAGRPLTAIWLHFARGGPRAVRAALLGYMLAYLFLSLFPYDFLIGAAEWRARLSPGRAAWLFAGHCGLGCWAKLMVEMLGAIPFGLLLLQGRSRKLSLAYAAAIGLLLGVGIELLQLSIASGISQGASALARAAGVMLGARLPAGFRNWEGPRTGRWIRVALALAAVPYAIVLMRVNHWFDAPWLPADAAFARLADVRFQPFYYHYYTSESVALVSLLFQAGLYAALGAAVWAWRRRAVGAQGLALTALLGATAAAVIETGRLFVTGQHPDPTNVLIAACAAAASHALLAWLFPSVTAPAASRQQEDVADKVPQTAPEAAPVLSMRRERGARRPLGMLLLAGALLSVISHPLGWPIVVLTLGVAAVCWRWPRGWVVLVPAGLPLLDLGYLTGRMFWSEFDTLVLVCLAAAYSRERVRPAIKWPGRLPLVIYVLSAFVGMVIGLLPLAPLDLNAFSRYTSPYHALVAVKGLAFALAFLPLIKAEWHANSERFAARLASGMSIGLMLELVYVLWERATFSGLLNFATDYRITGSFPGMNIGGASIEAYLVLAAPFVWLWAWPRQRAGALLVAGGAYVLASYGVMVTFSRGGQAAFVFATLLLLAGFSRLGRKARAQSAVGGFILLATGLAAGLVAWPILSGKFSESRLATIQTDIGIRTTHWRDTLAILPQAGSLLFGAGAGSYASAYYWYSSAPARPATYAFVKDGGNAFLRLGGGESLYFEQQVPVQPRQRYRVSLDVRTWAAAAALTTPVCEKAMLYSFACDWHTIRFSSTGGRWQHQEFAIGTDRFGPPGSLLKRPVKLSMFNPNPDTLVDVDNVALLDEAGHNLVRNGDFTQGMRRWFFSTDSHLAWHAKNLFVHVLFEQGIVGLAAFVLVLATAGWSLARRMRQDALALTLFVSLASFLIIGLIDSLIDEPRLDFLLCWLLLIALVTGGRIKPSRQSRPRPRHEPPVQSRDEGRLR